MKNFIATVSFVRKDTKRKRKITAIIFAENIEKAGNLIKKEMKKYGEGEILAISDINQFRREIMKDKKAVKMLIVASH